MGKSRSKSKAKLHSARTINSPISNAYKYEMQDIDVSDGHVNNELYEEIMNKLGGKPNDKQIGATLLSSSIHHASVPFDVTQLTRLIRTLAPLSCDRVENVRSASVEALSHLSSFSDSSCELMIACDVMTPLCSLLKTYSDVVFTQDDKDKKNIQIFVDLCQLLANLCNESNKALKIFTNSQLFVIMLNAIKSHANCIDAAIAAAECVSVLSEDNLIPQFTTDENLLLMKSFLLNYSSSAPLLHLATLSASIILNLVPSPDTDLLNTIFQMVEVTLSESCLPQVQQEIDFILNFVDNEKELVTSIKPNHDQLIHILSSKRIALELLTNSTSDDDQKDDADDEEMMECDVDSEGEDECQPNDGQDNDDERKIQIKPEIEQLILEKDLFAKIISHLSMIQQESINNLEKHSFGKEILFNIRLVQKRSLCCIHNFIMAFPSDKLTLTDEVCQHIYDLSFSTNNINHDLALIDESSSAIRAILTKHKQLQMPIERLENLCKICQTKNVSVEFKMNVIKIMALLASRSSDMQLIEKVTSLLMDGAQSDADLVVKAEIFDAIIDVYSEDGKTDDLIKRIGLIHQLKRLSSQFKKEASKDMKKWKQDPIVSTVRLNLTRFIKYKEKMLASVSAN